MKLLINKKRLLISVLWIFMFVSGSAQVNYQTILDEIATHNTELVALQKKMEAEIANHNVGLLTNQPQVGFDYLWGNSIAGSNRIDFSVTQSFEMPWVYVYKSRMSSLQDESSKIAYRSAKQRVLMETMTLCINLVYHNAAIAQCQTRLDNATRMVEVYQKKMDNGSANILDFNKARVNQQMVKNEFSLLTTEKDRILRELKRLNGGNDISLDQVSFVPTTLPSDFEQWYSEIENESLLLQLLKNEVSISENDVKLAKASNAPKLFVGYMNESVFNADRFQGVTAGLTIPLWENKKRVSLAKAQLEADCSIRENAKVQLYNNLKSSFARAGELKKAIEEYREMITPEMPNLLKKALDAGELSLLDYLNETRYYYEAYSKMLEMERDYELCVAELMSVTLLIF